MSPTKTRAGVVESEGQVHTHQHRVFPKENAWARWFKDRGIDVDDWCIDVTPPEHQAQHGGGNWALARRVAKKIPDAEWNAGIMDRMFEQELAKQQLTGNPRAKLTPEEIVAVGKKFMKERQLGEVPLRRYER